MEDSFLIKLLKMDLYIMYEIVNFFLFHNVFNILRNRKRDCKKENDNKNSVLMLRKTRRDIAM